MTDPLHDPDGAPAGDGVAGPGGGRLEEMPVEAPRRGASMTLQTDDVRQARAASLEAANQSLADALRIMYRLLQVVMIALAALFLLSGFQQVDESERAVKIEFGRVVDANLETGAHFSLPYPLGEVRKVATSAEPIRLDTSFFPRLSQADQGKPFQETSLGRTTLIPGTDGSLITADVNLAVARWQITYERAEPEKFLEHIVADDERTLVQRVAESAIVHAAASRTADELIGGGADGGGAQTAVLQRDVQARMQERLDAVDSGIRVVAVTLTDQIYPPRRVYDSFLRSDSAVSQAEADISAARKEADQILTQVAGTAYRPILQLIDVYERLLDDGDEESAEHTLEVLFDVLDGAYAEQSLIIDGVDYGQVQVTGQASRLLTEARSYRDTVVQEARSDAERFAASRRVFEQSPELFVTTVFQEAMLGLFRNTPVELFTIPDPEGAFEILLNSDPEIAAAIERERNRREREAAERERNERLGF